MVQKRKGIAKPRHQPFLQEYNFEITVVVLLALGIFLLVEDMEIKHYLYIFIKAIFFAIGKVIKWLRDGTIFVVKQFEVSDLVGISLILLAVILIANRWRERMIERFTQLNNCPECGGHIHRIRRNLKQTVLSVVYFVDVKHYHCKSCSYKGIKLVKR